MGVFEYFNDKNNENRIVDKWESGSWADLFSSTAKKKFGKTFAYINTNFRYLKSFINGFTSLYEYVGINRDDWRLSETHGQEKAKQWVVNMTQSKLFVLRNRVVNLTLKGKAFQDFIDLNLDEESNWFLIFLFLLNSNFDDKINYIFEKTQIIFQTFENIGFNEDQILDSIFEILHSRNYDKETIINSDIFWLLSFYKDQLFLQHFIRSNPENIRLLKEQTIDRWNRHIYIDCITRKYKPQGQYTLKTFLDDLKVLYFSKKLLRKDPITWNDFINYSIEIYSEVYNVSNEAKEFIFGHDDTFKLIFDELFNGYVEPIPGINHEEVVRRQEKLRKQSIELADYKCALEAVKQCESHYFKAKSNNRNYVEGHHLIPYAFANVMEEDIEIIENYVPLCPVCHKKIHYGLDAERREIIEHLWSMRKKQLSEKGVDISLERLLKFYNIES